MRLLKSAYGIYYNQTRIKSVYIHECEATDFTPKFWMILVRLDDMKPEEEPIVISHFNDRKAAESAFEYIRNRFRK